MHRLLLSSVLSFTVFLTQAQSIIDYFAPVHKSSQILYGRDTESDYSQEISFTITGNKIRATSVKASYGDVVKIGSPPMK